MHRLFLTASLLSLTACDLAPDFKLPEIAMPSMFKEDVSADAATVEPATDGKWKRVDDKAHIEEFAWWRMFGDAQLDGLMEQAMKDNPSIDAALERVNGARALAENRDADLYPAIEVGVGPVRTQPSPANQRNLPPGQSPNTKPYTLYHVQGSITYELDLFGRNRNRAAIAWFDASGEEDNFRAARLSLQAELAQTYFRLAALTAEEKILTRNVAAREESLALLRKKQEVGAIDTLVLSSAETDAAAVKVDAATVAQSRAMAEHALAVLVGVPPSELKIDVADLTAAPPTIPAGIPSSLLERRPDIKRAVSAIAAANARIGVARTGYFPDISLSAVGGFVSGDLNELFNWSNRTWTLGPMVGTVLTQPIFEGGRIAAARAQTDADYGAAVAEYRAAVLNAFREVEDQLSGLRNVGEQSNAARAGLVSATRAYDVVNERYKVGYSSRIEHLDAERSKLAAERANVQLLGNQYITTIQLVKALGGSWQAPSVPEVIAPEATPAAEPKPEMKPEAAPTTLPEPAKDSGGAV